ncbi:apolipoprotein N-acyltransferase [Faunimonas pinastri]|nr:apolipoprotein N-acyltransferase [Faunimonas pinastri]
MSFRPSGGLVLGRSGSTLLDRMAYALILTWGWRRWLVAFLAGAASALSQPPYFAFPVLWITFPVLVWLIDGAVASRRGGRVRRFLPAFAVGWSFGFGYFLAGLWWIGAAFLVDAGAFGWLMPLAVLALPAGLALFWGLGAAIAQAFWREGWRRVFALALGLGIAEWLRGTVLTGFPWNEIGYALTAGDVMMQSAGLFGLYGLNVLALVIFASPAALAPIFPGQRRPVALPFLGLVAIITLAGYGFVRLSDAREAFVPGVKMRIVQPAFDPASAWGPEDKDKVLDTFARLSTQGSPLTPGTVLVWPESSFPFALTEDPDALSRLADLMPPGVSLVTGAARVETLPDGSRKVYNSVYVIDDNGTIQGGYDKVHLVPFGEYLPFQGFFDRIGFTAVNQLPGGFSPGTLRHALSLPGAPSFAPLVCYEVIFPGAVVPRGERPGFIINVTNDSWFGRTSGPYQHFHFARVRSVEEGLPMVRAADTGISAVVDGYGRVIEQSPLGGDATVDSQLPIAAPKPPDVLARGFILPIMLCLCLALVLTRGTRSTR